MEKPIFSNSEYNSIVCDKVEDCGHFNKPSETSRIAWHNNMNMLVNIYILATANFPI